jgi:chemotaxis protein MotB
MAGKGGGAWKVAYADFVTAMMAFFLVMWLTAQDQQIKKAVSYYFMDPLGASRRPWRGGGVINDTQSGSLPNGESVGGGRGRHPLTPPSNEPSKLTKAVSDWLRADPKAHEYWGKQVRECRDRAAALPEVVNKTMTLDDATTAVVARRLKEELSHEAASKDRGILQDLLFASLAEVNWTELAEDLVYAK